MLNKLPHHQLRIPIVHLTPESPDKDLSGRFFITLLFIWHFDFSFVSKNKKLKGAKKLKAKILFWAILMFLRLALWAIRRPYGL